METAEHCASHDLAVLGEGMSNPITIKGAFAEFTTGLEWLETNDGAAAFCPKVCKSADRSKTAKIEALRYRTNLL
jgi:hypothetical protein